MGEENMNGEFKKIQFKDFFRVPEPEKTKIKFNMNAGDVEKPAWDLLLKDVPDASEPSEWIKMNAHKKRQANNNLNKATYLLAFAQYSLYGPEYFVFGGMYTVEKILPEVFEGVGYKLHLLPEFSEYRKRLIVKLTGTIGRDAYNMWYQTVVNKFDPEIYELTPAIALGKFPGYNNVRLTHTQLSQIWTHEDPQWKQYLSCVKGVYCITDTATGRLYIGSASGKGEGLWQRWRKYADPNDLTGGNKRFEELKKEKGADYIKENFTYSILEIFDIKTKEEVILGRESFWKDVFQTRSYGMNKN